MLFLQANYRQVCPQVQLLLLKSVEYGFLERLSSLCCTFATLAGLSTDKSNFGGSAKTTLRTANQVFHIYTGEPPSIFVRHRKNLGCVLPTHFTGINRAIRSSLHQCHACRLNSLKLFIRKFWKKKHFCQKILQLANIPAALSERRPHRRHRYWAVDGWGVVTMSVLRLRTIGLTKRKWRNMNPRKRYAIQNQYLRRLWKFKFTMFAPLPRLRDFSKKCSALLPHLPKTLNFAFRQPYF